MNKVLIFLFIKGFLFISLGLLSRAEAKENSVILPNLSPTPELSAKIERIDLNKSEIISRCPPSKYIPADVKSVSCPEDNQLVEIKTVVNNPKNQKILYFYTISGGRIVGQGENVTWDLNGVRAGIYTISAAIGNGQEISTETQTREIRVRDCICHEPCVCPTVDVGGGGDVKAGETVTFTAKLSGDIEGVDISYKWTISAGEILEGQGTPTIKVKTNEKMIGKTVTAKVELGGFPPACSCQPSDEETAKVVSP